MQSVNRRKGCTAFCVQETVRKGHPHRNPGGGGHFSDQHNETIVVGPRENSGEHGNGRM